MTSSDPTEAALFQLIGAEPLHVDEIRAQSGLPIERVSAALTMMELKGMVRQGWRNAIRGRARKIRAL